MPVKIGPGGERSVEASVEVPGTPEEVWRAIASGPGISSWFVPSTVDERVGGLAVSSFGPGMDSAATITAWDPPRSYIAETREGPVQVATEWIVEARAGGTCLVRVVHRWFADNADWDGEFEGHVYGWAASFFRMLRISLTQFPGQPCSAFQLAAFSAEPAPRVWRAIREGLRVDGATGRVESVPGMPPLSGVAERLEVDDPELLRIRSTAPQIVAALEGMEGENPELLVCLERPAPGLAHLFVMAMGEQTMLSIRLYLYGDAGARAAAEAERQWGGWLAATFPAADEGR